MNESIKKMYEQEPKTWYAKIIVALIVAALLAWSLSTVQSTGSNGSGLSVAGKIINLAVSLITYLCISLTILQ